MPQGVRDDLLHALRLRLRCRLEFHTLCEEALVVAGEIVRAEYKPAKQDQARRGAGEAVGARIGKPPSEGFYAAIIVGENEVMRQDPLCAKIRSSSWSVRSSMAKNSAALA